MISRQEITGLSLELGLEASQIEKDYVLGWMLAAISQDEELADSWVLKGGTCIRKCFFENYRYSEDLDFTSTKKFDLEQLQVSITRIASWVYKRTGIIIDTKRSIFEAIQNSSNQCILQGRVFYQGPSSPTSPRAWPRIKLDITSDELMINPSEHHHIIHPYSDADTLKECKVITYNFYDLLAEKMRALFERTRPRDLYDVVEIFKRSPEIDSDKVKKTFHQKCLYKNMTALDLENLKIESCAAGWDSQLSHQLQTLPSFEVYLEELQSLYRTLELGKT
jgi:predicted nucleotidyltransferase component of viral defense system